MASAHCPEFPLIALFSFAQPLLAALAPQKRGPKIPANRAEMLHIAQLTRERDGLRHELDKAMLVIGVQKKLATLLDTLNNDKSVKP